MDKKALILVVDDNSECRALLVWVLERHGFRTISATCGREAVALAIEFQPSLVLTDLSMPEMNGYEATQAIHSYPQARAFRSSRYPQIALTPDMEARISTDTLSRILGSRGRKKRSCR